MNLMKWILLASLAAFAAGCTCDGTGGGNGVWDTK